MKKQNFKIDLDITVHDDNIDVYETRVIKGRPLEIGVALGRSLEKLFNEHPAIYITFSDYFEQV